MNGLMLFRYEKEEVRIVTGANGEPWWVATDVCQILGIKNTTDAIKGIDEDERSRFNLGGGVIANLISESGLYELIMRSDKPLAKTFRRWIRKEVLPSIRKTGEYSASLPKTLPDALRKYAQEIEKREVVEKLLIETDNKLAIASPKAEYYDNVMMAPGTFAVTQIAKAYGMTAIAFNSLLKELGVQWKCNGQWVLRSKYDHFSYTKPRTFYTTSEQAKDSTHWTQKGGRFLYEFLKERDILPQGEKKAPSAEGKSQAELGL